MPGGTATVGCLCWTLFQSQGMAGIGGDVFLRFKNVVCNQESNTHPVHTHMHVHALNFSFSNLHAHRVQLAIHNTVWPTVVRKR